MTVYVLMEQTPGENGGNARKAFGSKEAATKAAKEGGTWFYVEEVEAQDLFNKEDLENVAQGAAY